MERVAEYFVAKRLADILVMSSILRQTDNIDEKNPLLIHVQHKNGNAKEYELNCHRNR